MKTASAHHRNSLLKRALILTSLALATIVAGLFLRLVAVGLPSAVVKWGGSVLWAAMVYLLLAAGLSGRRPLVAAGIAAGVAAVVELSRLYHSPGLDAFRLSMAGKLLLGRVFSVWHIPVYWAAIGMVAGVDWWWVRRRSVIPPL